MSKAKIRYTKDPTLKQLEALYKEWYDENNTHMPPAARVYKKFSDKDANKLTEAIIWHINLAYAKSFSYRVNNVGIYDASRGAYRRSNTIKGIADIDATINGRSIKIEVKHGKDRLSQHQRKYADRVEEAGGVYIVARTFREYISTINQIL